MADERSWTQKWMDDKTKRLDNGTGFGLSPSTKGYEMVTLVCIRREMVFAKEGLEAVDLGDRSRPKN